MPAEPGCLQGRIALVTGGASGIGRAASLQFAALGATVVVADLHAGAADETVGLVHAAGGSADAVTCDVAHGEQVAAMVATVLDRHGRLDIAHNNAGLGGEIGLTHECTEENWDHVTGIVLRGTWLCMKHELAAMLAQEPRADGTRGVIVNTASTVASTASPGVVAYGAAKHGVLGLTRTASAEYVRHGIRVNAICPGATLTPLLRASASEDPARLAAIAASQPTGRIAEPEEAAAAAVWLCTPAASYVNGVALTVDLGAAVSSVTRPDQGYVAD